MARFPLELHGVRSFPDDRSRLKHLSPLMKKLSGRFHFHSCSPDFLFKCKFPSEQQRPINDIDPRTHQELKGDAAITRRGILHPLLHILCGSSELLDGLVVEDVRRFRSNHDEWKLFNMSVVPSRRRLSDPRQLRGSGSACFNGLRST